MKRILALSACLAAVASAASAAPAAAVERVDATFFAEYSAPSFEIDQGEIVLFKNKDPFLAHGLTSDDEQAGEPFFGAQVIAPKRLRLLRGAPFLTTGTYPFHCPVHDSMVSTLEVNANGDPLPPDTDAPTATVSIKRLRLRTLLRKRRLTVTVDPAEVQDVGLAARAGGLSLLTAERTYLSPGPRLLVLKISRGSARSLKRRAAELRDAGRRFLKLRVELRLNDVAGNAGAASTKLRLRLGARPSSARQGSHR